MSASESRDESFEVETNSPFYFNTSHWRAVDGMLEGVRERAGLMILTGPTGSGKTMIMRAISEGLKENTPGLFLQYASLNFREFVNFLHSSLRVDEEVMDAPNKAVALREFLYIQAKRDETGVVFIDEAHNLEPDVLKMLPKLARFDTLEDGRIVGLQFVLIGSDDLRDTLRDPDFIEVKEKVNVSHELRFFTREELKQFLKKRLAPIARLTDEPITEDGIEEMGRFTGGSPRLIGMICSHTMLFAAENPGKSIDAKMVEEAAEALMLTAVDNPFADEEGQQRATSGPFSEADLSGEAMRASASSALPEFSNVDTVYASDDAEEDALLASMTGDVAPNAAVASGVSMPKVDDDLYADDHALSAVPEPAVSMKASALEEIEDDDDVAFDHAAFDRSIDDDLDGFDDDGEFGDLDYEDDNDAAVVAKAKKPAVKKGNTSFLSRLGWGAKKPEMPEKVIGAGRAREKAIAIPAKDIKKRGPKVAVAGAREKKMKMGGIAAAVVAVVGLGYVAHKPVISAVSGMFSKPAQMASAPRVAPVRPAPVPQAPAIQQAQAPAPDQQPVTIEVKNERSAVTGGWGARVVVEGRDTAVAPEVVAALASPAAVNDSQDSGPAVPGVVNSAAKGALDLVDKALGVGERNSNDKVGGVLAAVSGQVAGLRNKLSNDGLTPQQAAEKARQLVIDGDAHFAARRYTSPAGGSAYDSYREALALSPEDEKAKAGISNLREHYAKKAESARNARQWEKANKYFETAISISNLRPIS